MVRSIQRSFENIKYISYPRNADFDDLPIEYEKRFKKKLPIDSLNDNTKEKLKVVLIECSLDNRIYESNPKNNNFGDLHFDGDESLIARQRIYRINDDIVISFNNGLSVYVKTNQM